MATCTQCCAFDQGQPWATDTALEEGLERIRVAVNEASARPALDPDSAAALAQSVRDQVDFLIANCRLEPDADATLHVFIARLLNAAAALQEDPASPVGLQQMQQTLREYPPIISHIRDGSQRLTPAEAAHADP